MKPRRSVLLLLTLATAAATLSRSTARTADSVADIGQRLEMFVDGFLVSSLKGAVTKMHSPVEVGSVLKFDKPWEGKFCAYATVIHDGGVYRLYYRGKPEPTIDGSMDEVTCYAESRDGITWTKPNLGLFEVNGTRDNNLVLKTETGMPASSNFSPFLDTRPGVPASERYKALGGLYNLPVRQGRPRNVSHGYLAFGSPDGIHWKKLQDQAVIGHSQYPVVYNDTSLICGFWSETERQYVCYVRAWRTDPTRKPVDEGWGGNIRWVGRTTSPDFIHWSPVEIMSYGDTPLEEIYSSQTAPYFRAPHIYLGLGARFLPGRQVLSESEAKSIDVNPAYYKDCSDVVLLTSRGGAVYDRTFLEGFIRPGLGMKNWSSRSNYPARNVVATGPSEVSIYIQRQYAQPDHHLSRFKLRTDGFASVSAPYRGGEMITRPLTFAGKNLIVNFSTSAPGSIRVEIQDASGTAVPGFALADATEMIGDEIERVVSWKGGRDVGALAGRPIRLRFVMRDADLFSLRFRD